MTWYKDTREGTHQEVIQRGLSRKDPAISMTKRTGPKVATFLISWCAWSDRHAEPEILHHPRKGWRHFTAAFCCNVATSKGSDLNLRVCLWFVSVCPASCSLGYAAALSPLAAPSSRLQVRHQPVSQHLCIRGWVLSLFLVKGTNTNEHISGSRIPELFKGGI